MPDERAETDQTQSQATNNIAWFLTGAFIGAAADVELGITKLVIL